jgi:transcriptional regulator with XRE-family HTH domain
MGIKLEDFLGRLPEEDREAIAARTTELIREEATLRELREVRARSQAQLAERLKIGQAAVSKLERRTDMYISTLRGLIAAMGGELEIVARFPDRPPVRITQFEELAEDAVPLE